MEKCCESATVIMIGVQPRFEELETRNSSSSGGDEIRDQAEKREESEPLDAIRSDLEALKLVAPYAQRRQDLLGDASWEEVQRVRNALTAEIEVRKRHKRGSWKQIAKKPSKETLPSQTKKVAPSSDSSVQSAHGTELYPIPLSSSLEQRTRNERKRHALMERRIAKAQKPPLPPRARPPPPPPPSQPLTSPPRTSARQSMLKLASPNPKPNNQVVASLNSIQGRSPIAGVKQPATPKFIEQVVPIKPKFGPMDPIFVDTVNCVPGEYNEPIFVDDCDFEDPAVVQVGSSFQRPRKTSAASHIRIFEEIPSAPTYQTSNLKKPAYSPRDTYSGPVWPQELNMRFEEQTAAPVVTKMYSEEGEENVIFVDDDHVDLVGADLVDLSQFDEADELELEYAQLINAHGFIAPKELVSRTSAVASPLKPWEGSLSKEKEQKNEAGDAEQRAARVAEETITIIPSTDEIAADACTKSFSELGKRSLVVEVGTGEQDLESTSCIKLVMSGGLIAAGDEERELGKSEKSSKPEPEASTTEGNKGADKTVAETTTDVAVEARNALLEALQSNCSIGQDLHMYYSRSRSGGSSSCSDAMDGYASVEEESDGRLTQKQNSFASDKKEETVRGATSKNRPDYSQIESVVAEYFGASKNRLTENATDYSRASKKRVFSETTPCCMAFY